ncbi:MAG: hypothetical protein JJT81_14360 [Rubellimicrobium sp.]|nr:hypothetical protein [Rubellimicrobium sp.]
MSQSLPKFHPHDTVEQVEEGNRLAPKFGKGGLMPCITTDAAAGGPLRFAETARLLDPVAVHGDAPNPTQP